VQDFLEILEPSSPGPLTAVQELLYVYGEPSRLYNMAIIIQKDATEIFVFLQCPHMSLWTSWSSLLGMTEV